MGYVLQIVFNLLKTALLITAQLILLAVVFCDVLYIGSATQEYAPRASDQRGDAGRSNEDSKGKKKPRPFGRSPPPPVVVLPVPRHGSLTQASPVVFELSASRIRMLRSTFPTAVHEVPNAAISDVSANINRVVHPHAISHISYSAPVRYGETPPKIVAYRAPLVAKTDLKRDRPLSVGRNSLFTYRGLQLPNLTASSRIDLNPNIVGTTLKPLTPPMRKVNKSRLPFVNPSIKLDDIVLATGPTQDDDNDDDFGILEPEDGRCLKCCSADDFLPALVSTPRKEQVYRKCRANF